MGKDVFGSPQSTSSVDAADGVSGTGITAPAGGVGLVGWLSGIYARLGGVISVSVSGGALETGGNLAITATETTATVTSLGSDATGVTQPTGGTGVRGWLSGIYAKLNGTLSVSVTTLPLPTGAATNTSLQQILSAIQASVNIAGTVWYDPTTTPPTFYVRTESVAEGSGTITVSWQNPAGTAATPANVSNLVSVSYDQNIQSSTIVYNATGTGTGYTTGDILIHCFGIDTVTSPITMAYSFWTNAGPSVASGSILASAPTSGTFVQNSQAVSAASLPLPTGATTAVTQTAISTATGTTADTAWVSGSGSIVAILKGIFGKLASALSVATPDTRLIDQILSASTLNATFTVALNAQGSVGITISGLASSGATLTLEGTDNIGAAVPIWAGVNGVVGSTLSQTFTTDGNFRIETGARTGVRLRVSTVGTGNITISSNASSSTGLMTLAQSIPAGTNVIGAVTGSVGGYTATNQVTPTVQAASYAVGVGIGGLISFTTAARVAAGSGLIQSIMASFTSGVVPSLDVIFFNANPTGSTVGDKVVTAIVAADVGKIIGVAHLTDSTLLGATAPSLIQAIGITMPFLLPAGTTLYAVVVTRTVITLTSTSDMTITARILQD